MARAELAIPLVAACGCAALVLLSAPVPLRGAAALALALYFPGAGIVAAALPGRPDAETRVLSVALSIAICVLLSFVLNAMHRLDAAGWAFALSGVACVGYLAALVHAPNPPSTTNPVLVRSVAARARHAVILILACAITAGAVREAARGALSQREYRFTDFWMVPEDVPKPSFATVGVRNEEGVATRYTIDIVARGALVDRYRSFRLPVGGERTFTVPLPNVAYAEPMPVEISDEPIDLAAQAAAKKRRARAGETALRVEARLYKDGDRRLAYRNVWVALPPAVPPKPEPVPAEGSGAVASAPLMPAARETPEQPLPSEVGMPAVRIAPRPVGSRLIPGGPSLAGADDAPNKASTNASAE